MRRLLVSTAFCLLLPAQVWAFSDEILPQQPEIAPTKTAFAYSARHGANPLPGRALSAMWFSDEREVPQVPVTEAILVVPPQALRLTPSRTELCSHAAIVAAEHDLPAPFFANLIQQESGFRYHVVSPVGAQGIAQFMPRVARAYGLENPFDPKHSLLVSAKFLRELLGQFGNLGLAAAAYNAGPRRVQEWMKRRGKLPEETRNYVRNITGHPAERWARVNARTEETTLPAHARCPGMPTIEVSVPEAAPVKVAKGKGKSKTKVAAKDTKPDAKAEAKSEAKSEAKVAAKEKAADKKPAGKSYTLASLASPGRKTAEIRDGKLRIMAPEKAAKPAAGNKKQTAKDAKKQPAKEAKPAAKRVKVASR